MRAGSLAYVYLRRPAGRRGALPLSRMSGAHMHDWQSLARTVRDYFPLILFGLIALLLLAFWVIIEAFRSISSQSELGKLRRKVDELEAERAYAYKAPSVTLDAMPQDVVLTPRWVRRGSAATTSDGGCLLIVDAVAPGRKAATLSIRLDGWPGARQEIRAGHPVEMTGNLGTYTLELDAVNAQEARLAVTLRSRHSQETA